MHEQPHRHQAYNLRNSPANHHPESALVVLPCSRGSHYQPRVQMKGVHACAQNLWLPHHCQHFQKKKLYCNFFLKLQFFFLQLQFLATGLKWQENLIRGSTGLSKCSNKCPAGKFKRLSQAGRDGHNGTKQNQGAKGKDRKKAQDKRHEEILDNTKHVVTPKREEIRTNGQKRTRNWEICNKKVFREKWDWRKVWAVLSGSKK